MHLFLFHLFSVVKVELVALEPELKQKSLATEKLMERLKVDQEEADKVKTRFGSNRVKPQRNYTVNEKEHFVLKLLRCFYSYLTFPLAKIRKFYLLCYLMW